MEELCERPVSQKLRVLRCGKCAKTIHCEPDDLLRFMRAHWPTCCGEVMVLITDANELRGPVRDGKV